MYPRISLALMRTTGNAVITRHRVGRMAARWQAPAGDPVFQRRQWWDR